MPQRDAPAVILDPNATREAIPAESFRQLSYFDPRVATNILTDPVATQIKGAWRNREQHGRAAYDQMMRHGAVSSPFRHLLRILQSIRVEYVAPQSEPTNTQKDMADFLNSQLRRISWPKIIDGWVGQGLMYGFSLAELTTRIEPWRGRPFVQVHNLAPIPQASLDSQSHLGGEITTSQFPSDWTCFDFAPNGTITGYWQYRTSVSDSNGIGWTTQREKLRILHFKHGGGDGNPFGESLLYPAFEHWADLYLLEKQEQLQLENSSPFITGSYKSDEPSPEIHEQFKVFVSEQDPSRRLLVGNNMTFGKVSQSDPDYVTHVEKKVARLTNYITQAMLMPNSVYRETGNKDLDTRNLTQMFLKFIVPALLDEIADVMTTQFGKRLIDANWSHVERDDYPRFTWRFVTPNDLRLVTSVLQMALPHLSSEKLGEVFAEYLPGFRSEYIAKTHEQSVAVKRPAAMPEENEGGANDPPPKEEGEDRERIDGDTGNAGSEVGADS